VTSLLQSRMCWLPVNAQLSGRRRRSQGLGSTSTRQPNRVSQRLGLRQLSQVCRQAPGGRHPLGLQLILSPAPLNLSPAPLRSRQAPGDRHVLRCVYLIFSSLLLRMRRQRRGRLWRSGAPRPGPISRLQERPPSQSLSAAAPLLISSSRPTQSRPLRLFTSARAPPRRPLT